MLKRCHYEPPLISVCTGSAGFRKNTTGSHDRIVLDDSTGSDEDDMCTDVQQRRGDTSAPQQPSHRSQTNLTSLQSHEAAASNSLQVRQVSDKESRKVLQRKQAEVHTLFNPMYSTTESIFKTILERTEVCN